MATLELIPLEFEKSSVLPTVLPTIKEITGLNVLINNNFNGIEEFFNPDRGQYDGGKIIEKFEPTVHSDKAILITSIDLYIPIFIFVFGLAKLGGKAGIVSIHRLMPEFYGLPADEDRLRERIIKESVHELGHLGNLRHCADYCCVMSSSNTADDLDVKGVAYCDSCRGLLK